MRIIKHFIDGIYSGIPFCCVISYCKGRNGIVVTKNMTYEQKYQYYHDPVEYIRCKKCEKKTTYRKVKNNGSLYDKIIKKIKK